MRLLNHSEVYIQLKHLILKTPSLKIFKMFFKLQNRTRDIAKFVQISIYLINQNCLNILYLCKFLRQKKGRPLYEKLVRRTASLLHLLCHQLNIRYQRQLSSHLLIPMFIGTPCIMYKGIFKLQMCNFL